MRRKTGRFQRRGFGPADVPSSEKLDEAPSRGRKRRDRRSGDRPVARRSGVHGRWRAKTHPPYPP